MSNKLISVLRRPLFIIPLCGVISVTLYCLFDPSFIPSLPMKNLGVAVDRFYRVSSPSSVHDSSCNPYTKPGTLHIQKGRPLQTTYDLFGNEHDCKPNNTFLHRLVKEGSPPSTHRRASVLLVGDSVDRELIKYMCYLGRSGGQALALSTSEMNDSAVIVGNNVNNGNPKICTFGQFDLSFSNYHFCGLDKESMWPDKPNPCNQPVDFETRWEAFTNWTASLRRRPDLVVIQSSLWDIARYQRLEYAAALNDTIQPGLSDDFIHNWISDMRAFVQRIKALLPKAHLQYRLLHECIATEGAWFKPPGSTAGSLGPTFSPLRVHQLREAQRHVAAQEGMDLLPLGDVLDGQRGWLRDDIHPGEMGNALFGEMILEALDRIRR